jgi:hypothetical protein
MYLKGGALWKGRGQEALIAQKGLYFTMPGGGSRLASDSDPAVGCLLLCLQVDRQPAGIEIGYLKYIGIVAGRQLFFPHVILWLQDKFLPINVYLHIRIAIGNAKCVVIRRRLGFYIAIGMFAPGSIHIHLLKAVITVVDDANVYSLGIFPGTG